MKNKKAGLGCFQIAILIISIFAFSWILYDSTKLIKNVRGEELVNCCPETGDGVICRDVSPDYENCKEDLIPSECDEVSSCQLGCCYDDEGICQPKSPKQKCESGGGEWADNSDCNILECRRGCCVLGGEVQFVTEKRCEKLSLFYGLNELDFRGNINTELECLGLSNQQVEGACVLGGDCRFVTNKECLSLDGSFYKNKLCTNPDLNTSCTKTEKTTCLDGKDEVYFIDSCGNIANVYDASKINNEEYWSEKVSKENSCNSDSGNIESGTCGNCNRFLGSLCGRGDASYGDNICKDLNCPNAPDIVDSGGEILKTKDRKNGESWCVYDSSIGNGEDTVGSRHWKYYCLDGEVKQEPCQDYRQEICVESEIENSDAGGEFSQASCRVNRWRECLDYNSLAEDGKNYSEVIEKCEGNSDCYVKEFDFGKGYHFYQCLPKYPPGLSLEERENINEGVCKMANFKCTKVEVKKISGWDCVGGCDCDSQSYTQQMNDYCKSLGDCGGYVNIIGEEDKAYRSDAPDIELGQYKDNIIPGEQAAEPGDISEILAGQMGLKKDEDGYPLPESRYTNFATLLGGISGVFGGSAVAISMLSGASFHTAVNAIMHGGFAWGRVSFYEGAAAEIGGFASASLGFAAGAIAGFVVAKLFGLKGQAVGITTAAGGVGGAIGGIIAKSALTGGLIGLGVAIAVALIMQFMGIGDTKETDYWFKCYPWQAPTGGEDCDLCNDDLKDCSEYRCNSLGQGCEMVNKGSEEEKCIWKNPDDVSSPKISPLYRLQGNFTYEKTGEGFKVTEDGKCIPEFTLVLFGIKTDENSQCKFDIENKDYEDMEMYFGEDNLYRKNHSMSYLLPSAESVAIEFNLSYTYVMEKLGELKLYVRCQDANGNYNSKPYIIETCLKKGPDLTSPSINKFVPEKDSYLKFNETEKEVKLYLNEPAECSWSREDKNYDEMGSEMDCKTGLRDSGLWGWECEDNLDLSRNATFYFRCKDQPWLSGENESERNVNQESFVYELKKSGSELEIDYIKPDNEKITSGNEPMTVNLELETSGGVNGKSVCYFRFGEGGWIRFMDTNSREHVQEFNQMLEGEYNLGVKCEDVAGNIAEGNTRFELEIDNDYPKVVRFYNDGNLKIITNEDAECRYSHKTCNFFWENGTKMSGSQKEHSAELTKNKYYIKCRDLWDNKPDGCSVIIKTG